MDKDQNTIVCQNCGKMVMEINPELKIAIDTVHYQCTCGSIGIMRLIVVFPPEK